MVQGTGLAQLLGLAGVEVDLAEQKSDESWTVYVASAPGRRDCCPQCGQASRRVKESTVHRFGHVVAGRGADGVA